MNYWRLGRHYPIHVYRSDEPVATFFTAADAASAVRDHNNMARLREITSSPAGIEYLCEVMHDAYERAAKAEGWETQEKSRKPWEEVPEENKATMRISVKQLLNELGQLAIHPSRSISK